MNEANDPFCPRHGRASRPVEVPGLRCDCLENQRARRLDELVVEAVDTVFDNRLNRAEARGYLASLVVELVVKFVVGEP